LSPPVDKTKSNVFLKGWWSDILPHLKWTFIFKFNEYDLNYYFRTVTDERLLTVWLGKEAYTSKQRKKREDEESYNSLGDLVGSKQHLVLIRLGELGHPNRAMAGVIKEACMMRQANGLATWLVESPDKLFQEGNNSYSRDLFDFIAQQFETIDLTQGDVSNVVQQVGFDDKDENLERHDYRPSAKPKFNGNGKSELDLGPALGEASRAKQHGKAQRLGKKNGKGGGPV